MLLLGNLENYTETPAYYAYLIQRIVKELSNNEDPFKEIKRLSNIKALEILKKLSLNTEDLYEILKLSAIGNLLDFAILSEEEAFNKLQKALNSDFGIADYEDFVRELSSAQTVLILGDNAGEIVFDIPLVEKLKSMGKKVIYVVKGAPILNDATYEDAEMVGLTKICSVITNGNDMVGTILDYASPEFLEHFNTADLIISKGQANFETLSEQKEKNIFFLLTVKCKPVAKHLSTKKVGDLVLRWVKKLHFTS